MITLIAFLLFIAFLAWCAWRAPSRPQHSWEMAERDCWIVAIGLFAFLYLMVSGIWAGVEYNHSASVHNSRYVINQLTDQRAEMSAVLRDSLASEDFMRLMDASTPDQIKFLGTRPEVTMFMLGRADKLVKINNRLFAEQNKLLDEARKVCNYSDNPIVPKFPLIGPDCELDELTSLFKDAG